MLPVTEPADALFAALRANQPITLTGDASQGYGVEVTGEAVEPTPAPTTDAGGATPAPSDSAVAETRVDLPSEISGTTAAQITCARAEQ